MERVNRRGGGRADLWTNEARVKMFEVRGYGANATPADSMPPDQELGGVPLAYWET